MGLLIAASLSHTHGLLVVHLGALLANRSEDWLVSGHGCELSESNTSLSEGLASVLFRILYFWYSVLDRCLIEKDFWNSTPCIRQEING